MCTLTRPDQVDQVAQTTLPRWLHTLQLRLQLHIPETQTCMLPEPVPAIVPACVPQVSTTKTSGCVKASADGVCQPYTRVRGSTLRCTRLLHAIRARQPKQLTPQRLQI
jgi:hypothetical protein